MLLRRLGRATGRAARRSRLILRLLRDNGAVARRCAIRRLPGGSRSRVPGGRVEVGLRDGRRVECRGQGMDGRNRINVCGRDVDINANLTHLFGLPNV